MYQRKQVVRSARLLSRENKFGAICKRIVRNESISIAVRNAAGKIVLECVIETKASMILQFVDGLRGDLYVTFEEGTWAAWLYDLLKPRVTSLVVCDPRRNALLQEGNQWGSSFATMEPSLRASEL